MKQIMKRVAGVVLAMALTAGGMVTQVDTVQAKNKPFENRCCKPYTESYMEDGSFEIDPSFTYGSRNEYVAKTSKGYAIKQGTVIRATLALTPGASVKSASVKSSNNKVIKVDQKTGTYTAKKLGTATISYKVVWSTSDKIYKVHRNTKKNGSTYTTTNKIKIRVVCKSHKYGDWVTKKEVSCERDGKKQRTCKKCKETAVKIIQATDHKYDSVTHKCKKCGEIDPDYDEE